MKNMLHRRRSSIQKIHASINDGNNKVFHGEEAFEVRKLEISDKKKGFVELLQQLSICDSISDEAFEERFREVAKYGNNHLICVIEDNDSGKIIAIGSVFIEKKFIRNCGKVGHIEDVVVDSNVRGKHLGNKIIEFLSDHARSRGCYRVILDCSSDKCRFMRGVVSSRRQFRW